MREIRSLGSVRGVPGNRYSYRDTLVLTPYVVPYRVKGDFLQILRVYHTSRTWPHRL